MTSVPAFRLPRKDVEAARIDAIRYRALERLYARQATVRELIGALERYQEDVGRGRCSVISIEQGRREGAPALRRRRTLLARA